MRHDSLFFHVNNVFIIQVQSNIDLIPVSATQKRARYIPCFGSAFWCLLCKLALKVNSAETAATNEDLVLLAAASCPCTTNTQESYTKNGRTLGPNQEKV